MGHQTSMRRREPSVRETGRRWNRFRVNSQWRSSRQAKDNYRRKLELKLQQNNVKDVWSGMRSITGYKQTGSQVTGRTWTGPMRIVLNLFFNRFDGGGPVHSSSSSSTTYPPLLPCPAVSPPPPLSINTIPVLHPPNTSHCARCAGHAQEHLQQQTVTTTIHNRTPQEILSSPPNSYTSSILFDSDSDSDSLAERDSWGGSGLHFSSP